MQAGTSASSPSSINHPVGTPGSYYIKRISFSVISPWCISYPRGGRGKEERKNLPHNYKSKQGCIMKKDENLCMNFKDNKQDFK